MSKIIENVNKLVDKYRGYADEIFADADCRRIEEEEFIASDKFKECVFDELYDETINLVRTIISEDHYGRYYAGFGVFHGKSYKELKDNRRKKIENFYQGLTDEIKKISGD